MEEHSRVDILMGTYNGALYVREQIESLQQQTYAHWRLLVRDDMSSDKTISILESIAENDSRVVLVADGRGNLGFNDNFRRLLSLSDGPYTMFCDQDDIWLPKKIEKALIAAKCAEDRVLGGAVLVHCDATVVDGSLKILKHRFIGPRASSLGLPAVVFANCVQGAASLLNRPLRELCLEIEASLPHDFHAALIAEAMGQRVFLSEPMLFYRQHGFNSIGADVGLPKAKAGTAPARSDLLASLHFGLGAAPHVKRILEFFEPRVTPHIKERIIRYRYVLSGKSRLKRIALLLVERYRFYRRLDLIRFVVAIVKGHA